MVPYFFLINKYLGGNNNSQVSKVAFCKQYFEDTVHGIRPFFSQIIKLQQTTLSFFRVNGQFSDVHYPVIGSARGRWVGGGASVMSCRHNFVLVSVLPVQ